jgi:hypothetical protein
MIYNANTSLKNKSRLLITPIKREYIYVLELLIFKNNDSKININIGKFTSISTWVKSAGRALA